MYKAVVQIELTKLFKLIKQLSVIPRMYNRKIYWMQRGFSCLLIRLVPCQDEGDLQATTKRLIEKEA